MPITDPPTIGSDSGADDSLAVVFVPPVMMTAVARRAVVWWIDDVATVAAANRENREGECRATRWNIAQPPRLCIVVKLVRADRGS